MRRSKSLAYILFFLCLGLTAKIQAQQCVPLVNNIYLTAGTAAARVEIPKGFTLVADRSDEKDSTSSGNWLGSVAITVPESDRYNYPRYTVFSQDFISAGYYWEQEIYRYEDAVSWTNTTEETEFLLQLGMVSAVSISLEENARSVIGNARLISEDGAVTKSICLEPVTLEANPPPDETCDEFQLRKWVIGPSTAGVVQIPNGSRLIGDVIDRKLTPYVDPPFIPRGNWIGRAELYTIGTNGRRDALVDSVEWLSAGYYWLRTVYTKPEAINILNDTGVAQDFILSLNTNTAVSVDVEQKARTETHNLRFVDENGVETPICLRKLPKYVALGDSYSSGFGVAPYHIGTNKDGPDSSKDNDCQRSSRAYAPIVAADLDLELNFHACQGSLTEDLVSSRQDREAGVWGEVMPQLDEIEPDTHLVTLSIGGNDNGFAEFYQKCILAGVRPDRAPLLPCSVNPDIPNSIDARITALVQSGSDFQEIDNTKIYPLNFIYNEIRVRAPTATVVVVGYPPMFKSDALNLEMCQLIHPIDQLFFHAQIVRLNSLTRNLVENRNDNKFLFADPSDLFRGHEFCTDKPWFFPILDLNLGEFSVVNPGKVHPTAAGQAALAEVVKCALGESSPNCGLTPDFEIPPLLLENNSWKQLVVPANVDTQTIGNLFGDDLRVEDYGVTWTVALYEPIANKYVDPGVDGIITQGRGFWMIQVTGTDAEIVLPTETTQTTLSASNACASPAGCSAAALATRNDAPTWSLVGSPFPYPIDPGEMRIVTTDENSNCTQGCTLQNAESIGYVREGLWHYESGLGEYRDISQEAAMPWAGHWIMATDSLDGQGNALLYPSNGLDE